MTTRFEVADLEKWPATAPQHQLLRLSREAGVRLLQSIGVEGSAFNPEPTTENPEGLNEFERLVEDVDGHALTLQVVGQYLKRAFRGDIRKRDRVRFEKAQHSITGNVQFHSDHAFRAIAAYEAWLVDDSEESRRELAVLRLLGLFDRPATADCVQALRQPPAIDDLTDPLLDLPDEDWEFTLTTLSDVRLVSVNRAEATGELVSLDAHPLIREYFGASLRSYRRQTVEGSSSSNPPSGDGSYEETDVTSDVWRAAHRRLYEHLCETTKEGAQPTLEDLQPLYQAVAHGCHAGLMQKAWSEVEYARILRGGKGYSIHRLGVLGSELSALANFFFNGWREVSSSLTAWDKTVILSGAGYCLRASGRLIESLDVMRASVDAAVVESDWKNAGQCANNLSELELTLGEVSGALSDAERSVTYADRSGDAFQRFSKRETYAEAMHQSGRRSEAESLFREAEQMQAKRQPAYPLLYSTGGFRYCDLLLAAPERAAWRMVHAKPRRRP